VMELELEGNDVLRGVRISRNDIVGLRLRYLFDWRAQSPQLLHHSWSPRRTTVSDRPHFTQLIVLESDIDISTKSKQRQA